MNQMHLSSVLRPKSILVATDLHDLDFLLPVAVDQARRTGAMIWLLHVIPPDAYVSIESGNFPGVQRRKHSSMPKQFSMELPFNSERKISLVLMKFVAGIRSTERKHSFASIGSIA